MKRSKYSLSYSRLLSCKMGKIVPIGLTEVLPGDTLQHNTSMLVRSLQLLAPLMHHVQVKVHHWFVPHRLVWTNWEDFITGGRDGLNASTFPTITASAGTGWLGAGGLADYLGVQSVGSGNVTVSALPFRGYGLIYNEWYRDNDLINPVTVSLADGADSTTNTTILDAAWEKDYFTSARATPKKGPSTAIPIGSADVISRYAPGAGESPRLRGVGSGGLLPGSLTAQAATADLQSAAADAYLDPVATSGISTLITQANSATMQVADLREALALQRYQEARSRYGSRYTEYLRYLNVRSSDARLQNPEYLGGGKAPLQFSEVLQTATGGGGVGAMAGHGISAMRTNRYRRFFEEHGYVHTFLIVRPRAVYIQGVERHWNRRTKEDFWQRELQNIGQQEVLNKEVYYDPAGTPDGTFGYQDRYDEYRRANSSVHGEFRTTLDYWHMGRDFGSMPSLNAAFVNCVPTTRIYPVEDEDTLYIMCNHSIQARRLVTRNATPRTF